MFYIFMLYVLYLYSYVLHCSLYMFIFKLYIWHFIIHISIVYILLTTHWHSIDTQLTPHWPPIDPPLTNHWTYLPLTLHQIPLTSRWLSIDILLILIDIPLTHCWPTVGSPLTYRWPTVDLLLRLQLPLIDSTIDTPLTHHWPSIDPPLTPQLTSHWPPIDSPLTPHRPTIVYWYTFGRQHAGYGSTEMARRRTQSLHSHQSNLQMRSPQTLCWRNGQVMMLYGKFLA